MAHGYSLRPNSKGRRRPQSTDETNEQVEGSTSTSTSTVDPRPATPTSNTPSSRAAHNPPGSIFTPSTISAATTTNYRVERRPETSEDIQAAGKREEARRTAQAIPIHREQVRRGYEGELRNWAIERGEIAVVVDAEDDGG
jgi:hypothetical protein